MILENIEMNMKTNRTERKTRLPSTSLHKAFDNIDKSRKDAIKIFCIECVGCAPGYRAEIRNCTDYGCPLYPWRPYKGEEKPSEESSVEEKFTEEKPEKKKKKCCNSPDVVKLKDNKRECKNCGKKWKRKKKESIKNGGSK